MDPLMNVVTAVIVLALVYVMLPVAMAAYRRYRGVRTVQCPATGTPAEIEVDRVTAAVSATTGHTVLNVERCSHWPERKDCGQECLAQVEPPPQSGARAA